MIEITDYFQLGAMLLGLWCAGFGCGYVINLVRKFFEQI